MKDMVYAPKALKVIDALDPSHLHHTTLLWKCNQSNFDISPNSQEHLLYQHDIF